MSIIYLVRFNMHTTKGTTIMHLASFNPCDVAPANVIEYKSLKYVRTVEAVDRVIVKAWLGKARKPFAFYRFSSEARADLWIEATKQQVDAREDRKQARKAEQAAAVEQSRRQFVVGTLLVNSWGYDQTNVDFYEIVERRGAFAVIREIAGRSVVGSEGSMSCRMAACPGEFIGEPMRKLIGPYGISAEHGCMSPTTADESHYCSWYH